MEIKVQTGIPLPDVRRRQGVKRSKYPFGTMAVDASFGVPVEQCQYMRQLAVSAAKKFGRKFTVAKLDGECRVWRTK